MPDQHDLTSLIETNGVHIYDEASGAFRRPNTGVYVLDDTRTFTPLWETNPAHTYSIDGTPRQFDIQSTTTVTPADSPIDLHSLAADNTEVILEGGDYAVTCYDQSGITVSDCIIRGAYGATVTLTADNWTVGGQKWPLRVNGGTNVAIENLTLDNTNSFAAGDMGLLLLVSDGLLLNNIDHVGWSGAEPVCEWSLYPALTTSTGVGEIRNYSKTGPSVFQGHGGSDGAGGIFDDHAGHLTFTNCHIANQGGDGGIYAGKHTGSVAWRDCLFENNDMALIRSGAGTDCVFENCTFRSDWTNADPNNTLTLPADSVYADETNHEPDGMNGLYLSTGEYGKTGGGVYNCTFEMLNTYSVGNAAIAINDSDGRIDIHDTTFQMDIDGMAAVWGYDMRNKRFPDVHATPPQPWGPDIRNVTITGSSTGLAAVTSHPDGRTHPDGMIVLQERDNTYIDGLVMDCPNVQTGLDISETSPVEIVSGSTDITVASTPINGSYTTV